ncbi:MAG: rhomboid family intramembrane serine protease [Deltaproteobacteria bacterium]|nr:rhomboid family intramembrane serine protease [Deltaproteobacteria bacterium]
MSESQRNPTPQLGPTLVIAAAWTLVCAGQYLWHGLDQAGLVRMGANLGELIGKGQWPRLVTSGWLHAGALHLFASVATLAWARPLERQTSAAGFTVIFASSMVGGAVAQALLEPGRPAATASAGAQCVVVATAWLQRQRETPRRGGRLAWFGVIGLQLLALAMPSGGAVAPLAGALTGWAAALLWPWLRNYPQLLRVSAWTYALLVATAFEWLWSATQPWQH